MPYRNPVLFALVLLLVVPLRLQAACLEQARTPYEKVYCEIVDQGQGAGLPAFEDFRRNTVKVQALLLKRPAARAGIELPTPTPSSRDKPVERKPPPKRKPQPAPQMQALDGCRLDGKTITCPHERYQLANNRPNSDLNTGALKPDNTLDLPRFQGDLNNESAVRHYLSRAYDRYIPKMLDIGLAGATMSFSEFYYSFRRHARQGVDFAKRLEQTYQLLKQDKRTKQIAPNLTDELPENIDHCGRINPRILVCDNVSTNWVYVRQ
ncbi:hypothetical protein QQM79_20015 [Marinobacteraceae bacterium S3BR75-40.1]